MNVCQTIYWKRTHLLEEKTFIGREHKNIQTQHTTIFVSSALLVNMKTSTYINIFGRQVIIKFLAIEFPHICQIVITTKCRLAVEECRPVHLYNYVNRRPSNNNTLCNISSRIIAVFPGTVHSFIKQFQLFVLSPYIYINETWKVIHIRFPQNLRQIQMLYIT